MTMHNFLHLQARKLCSWVPEARCSIFTSSSRFFLTVWRFFCVSMWICVQVRLSRCVCVCVRIHACVYAQFLLVTNNEFSSNGLHDGEWKRPLPEKWKRMSVKIVQHENTIARYASERTEENLAQNSSDQLFYSLSTTMTTNKRKKSLKYSKRYKIKSMNNIMKFL